MRRIIPVYGAIAGAIVAAAMLIPIGFGIHSVVVGYLSMLAALTMVFVGVKRYRDEHLGGTIRFAPALGVGLAIAAVASLCYVVAWEIYLYATDYAFMAEYADRVIEARRAEGASAAELARIRAEFDAFAASYRNPLFRMAMTAMEIAPVALLVSLASAALLRRADFMPPRVGRFEQGGA